MTLVEVGSTAPDFSYPTAQGERKQLREFWAEGPALVMWLRHFG